MSTIRGELREEALAKQRGTITTQYARTLASWWHGGQWSPLYSFTSTGRVDDYAALLDEIDECLSIAEPDDVPDLQALKEYVIRWEIP
jgi:hypothetical protein